MDVVDFHALDASGKLFAVDRVVVEKKILGRFIKRKGVGDLLAGPLCGRI